MLFMLVRMGNRVAIHILYGIVVGGMFDLASNAWAVEMISGKKAQYDTVLKEGPKKVVDPFQFYYYDNARFLGMHAIYERIF